MRRVIAIGYIFFLCVGYCFSQCSISNVNSGNITPHSFSVNAKLSFCSNDVGIAVSTDSLNFNNEDNYFYSVTDKGLGFYNFQVSGLLSDKDYYYKFLIGNTVIDDLIGHVKTSHIGPYSFSFGFSSCAKTGSNDSVFHVINQEDILFYINTGDLFYGDIVSDCNNKYYQFVDSSLNSPFQKALYLDKPLVYIWDDHDFGNNNSAGHPKNNLNSGISENAWQGTAPCTFEARMFYHRVFSHYPFVFGNDTLITQSFSIGRIRFLLTDLRSTKFRPIVLEDTIIEGSNFGTPEHLNWFKEELIKAKENEEFVIWINSIPFINSPSGPNYSRLEDDDWGGYMQERNSILKFIDDNSIEVCILSGDAHMLAIDDGSNVDYKFENAKVPVFHAGPLDQKTSFKGGPYSFGKSLKSGQYGLVKIFDDGHEEIGIKFQGKNKNNEIVTSDSNKILEFSFKANIGNTKAFIIDFEPKEITLPFDNKVTVTGHSLYNTQKIKINDFITEDFQLINDTTLLFIINEKATTGKIELISKSGKFEQTNNSLVIKRLTNLSVNRFSNYKIFPNPSQTGVFKLRGENDYIGTIFIEVRNIHGKLILSESIKKNMTEIELELKVSNKHPGIFFIKILDQYINYSKIIFN